MSEIITAGFSRLLEENREAVVNQIFLLGAESNGYAGVPQRLVTSCL